jgi:hypothetical protein
MSFGGSAGDITTAVKLIYTLIQALDSCDGAASDCREDVGFKIYVGLWIHYRLSMRGVLTLHTSST